MSGTSCIGLHKLISAGFLLILVASGNPVYAQRLADIAVIKTVDSARPASVEPFTYTITVTNHGPGDISIGAGEVVFYARYLK